MLHLRQIQMEVARLQKLGVVVRYMPTARVNFYSPSLFSVSGGTTDGFLSGETDVRMNLNAYFQLDTRMEIWSEWAMAKENYHLVQQEQEAKNIERECALIQEYGLN